MKAIQAKRDLKKNRALLKKKKQLQEKILREMERIEHTIDLGESVTSVYKGVPIEYIDNNVYGIEGESSRRYSTLYKNAHEPGSGKWDVTCGTFGGDECLGVGYTRRQVLRYAREWVAFGKLPPESSLLDTRLSF